MFLYIINLYAGILIYICVLIYMYIKSLNYMLKFIIQIRYHYIIFARLDHTGFPLLERKIIFFKRNLNRL